MTRRRKQSVTGPVYEGVIDSSRLARSLLAWYDGHRRTLPWRAPVGTRPDPYRVWLSEIMLQQTTVATVAPYFNRFVARWPTVMALAAATLDEVLHAWQGLGYYARARNLHRCARVVAERGGAFPIDEAGLTDLPGIGPYTAAAIAAIAFNRKATVVDGNVERVIARHFAVAQPFPSGKAAIHEIAARVTPSRQPGDYAQAVMDLGASVCTPRNPRCEDCPWRRSCAARKEGDPESYPVRGPRRVRSLRRGVAFWVTRADGAILLRRRPDGGLLGGMMEIPSTPWRTEPWDKTAAALHAPVSARWRSLDGGVRHAFTHFDLELVVWAGRAARGADADGSWYSVDQFDDLALATLTRKIIAHAERRASSTRRAASGATGRWLPLD